MGVRWPLRCGPPSTRTCRAIVHAPTIFVLSRRDEQPGEEIQRLLGALPGEPAIHLAKLDRPAGAELNAAAHARPGADVVVLAPGAEIGLDLWTRLAASALADSATAAATVEIAGSGDRYLAEIPCADGEADGTPLLEHVLWPWAHAAWIRRPALDLVGGFDPALVHPGAALADFGARASGHGLLCVLVPDPSPQTRPDRPVAGRSMPSPKDRERLERRHPWFSSAARTQWARAAMTSRKSGEQPVSVTLDARALGLGPGGSQTYVSDLVAQLAASSRVRLRALIRADAGADVADALGTAGVEVITPQHVRDGLRPSDLVHRPQQAFTLHDLALLRDLGRRLLITQMDFLLYTNPAYHPSAEAWREHQRVTRAALAAADGVTFFTEHTRRLGTDAGLVDARRTAIVGIGVDRPAAADAPEARPARIDAHARFLLLLGTDLQHKNRPFAMALADELRRRHGWDGLLVLAGPHARFGSSAEREAEVLEQRPQLRDRIVDLGRISEPERRWLAREAQAHLCTSSVEGFGLIPLEAARAERPCIYAAQTSLAEIIDPAAATIEPWDPVASADRAAPLLEEGPERRTHLELLRQALARHTWSAATEDLLAFYALTTGRPRRAAGWLALDAATAEAERDDLQLRVGYGQRLIDRDGGLLSETQQRGLMRIASRRAIRGPLLTPLGMLGGLAGRPAKPPRTG